MPEDDFEKQVFENLQFFYRRNRRWKWASYFELIVVSLFFGYHLTGSLLDPSNSLIVYSPIKDPIVAAFSSALFVEILTMILSENTVVVGAIYQLTTKPQLLTGLLSTAFPFSGLSGASELAAEAAKAIARKRKAGPTETPAQTPIDSLRLHAARSFDAVRASKQRPDALLFVGSTIAGIGVILFIYTLPSNHPETEIFTVRALDLLPRAVLFLFIQVLAGFFLRQYRIAVEDHRYYEAILRYREDQISSFLIIERLNNDEALLDYQKKLLDNRDFVKISQGETSLQIETNKIETNEFLNLATTVIDKLSKQEGEIGKNKTTDNLREG